MTENIKDVAAERDALRAQLSELVVERDALRRKLTAAGTVGRVAAPAHTFQLSQAQLSELEIYGVTNVDGVQRTTAEVRGMLTGNQSRIKIKDASNPQEPVRAGGERSAVYGVDYVYPSVAPGKIDPAVAGTPGISGPSADAR